MKKNIVIVLTAVLTLACQERKTTRAEEFRENIHLQDSTELAQAQAELTKQDSVITFSTLKVEDMKRHFVFEIEKKYQTVGYWVLPPYKGSKERFTFFPEVEEGGKLLLVSIDKQRRYAFTEVDLDSEDYEHLLPKGLSEKQRKDVEECYAFAKTMKQLDDARKNKEKMELKVRFFEKKMKK